MSEDINNKWEALAGKDLPSDESDNEEQAELTPGEDDVVLSSLDHPDYQALQDKLTEAEQQVHENWEARRRAIAELDNLRKRSDRDVENAHKFAVEKFINELLPVIDSLEQALELADDKEGDENAMRQGIELTVQLFHKTLEKYHVIQINPVGESFDPNRHEAMSMQPSDEVDSGMILQVFQKGYLLYDRVIRPARVIVSK
jgi:molecular chaperone GrpE